MGLVSSLGHEVDTFYNSLLEGQSGITRIQVSFTSFLCPLVLTKCWPPYLGPSCPSAAAKHHWKMSGRTAVNLMHAVLCCAQSFDTADWSTQIAGNIKVH